MLTRWRQRTDEDNTGLLGEVLSARGWPGRTLAGENDAAAAWLLALHADRDPVRRRAFLDALRSSGRLGKACPAHQAYLEAGSPASLRRP